MDNRIFDSSRTFKDNSHFNFESYQKLYSDAKSDSDQYWLDAASDLAWSVAPSKAFSGTFQNPQWFEDGFLNASYNAIDRHVITQPNKTALIWEGEPVDPNDPSKPKQVLTYTYSELLFEVQKVTAMLRKSGVYENDRVAIYMPMIPEALFTMLACARMGCPHTVVFGGFKSEALMDRMIDFKAKFLITADYGYRRGEKVLLLEEAKRQFDREHSLKNVFVFQRDADQSASFATNSFILNASQLSLTLSTIEIEKLGYVTHVPAEHPLFVLYTSGTTGKPKGLLHTTGGYLTGVLRSMKYAFDIKADDRFFCTADIGWITGHSYVTYGPLLAGCTLVVYEGAPMYPNAERWWKLIDRHQVSILYTAPTAIRSFMRLGEDYLHSSSLNSLRLLGSVGEPINPEAWVWYHDKIGKKNCPIVDTYWQTETGSIVIAPHPAWTPQRPGSATTPLPGYSVKIVDQYGKSVTKGQKGKLCISEPWPSMARTILNDPDRFRSAYFSEVKGHYFTGDGAIEQPKDYIWCLGRMDDVLNVSGHRIGTMEIESACVSHPAVAEAAAIGKPDEIKGQSVTVFVSLKQSVSPSKNLESEIKKTVAEMIGAFARPDEIRFTQSLPKTRSGKIMRRLLREIATTGTIKGDTSTLEDYSSIAQALQTNEDEA